MELFSFKVAQEALCFDCNRLETSKNKKNTAVFFLY